jgi:hypothetical protein
MGYRKVDVNPFNSILSIIFLVAIFIGLYYLATGIFKILTFLTPFMLIAALVIDYRVVLNYGKWLLNTLSTDLLKGLGMVLLMIFGYPIIAGYLLLKAVVSKKLQSVQADFEERSKPQYANYEEVDLEEMPYEDLSDEKPLDLNKPKPVVKPEIKIEVKPKPKEDKGDYDQFFE